MELARRFSVEPTLLHGALTDLRDRGLADWSPETHGSLADYLRRVARDFSAQAPA
jgi:hypothetical protein